MNRATSPSGYRVITADEAEARFDAGADLVYPYEDFADEQEIRLYEGPLHVVGNLEREGDGDWSPCNVIVDGDLTVDGDLEWWDSAGGTFLLVTGNVRARNVLLSGCPDVVVRGDLTVTGGVQGHHGDDGGFLTVKGLVRAQVVISTLYFNLDFARRPDALLIADTYRTTCPVDLTPDELDDIVLPELLDRDDRADEHKIGEALRAGRPVLRPGVRATSAGAAPV
ncbi:polymer-forming cytoskeletal protein [Streptomyces griseoruber]|uniref:Polymer-forming cytoskeletal protein n=1 Tax=Streptomyces griseoruber TaxID=1943 RepID=A0A101T1S9_9ACTN|nr:polymer-forming cytoskeletal protein [Streptomyces griseoruber]KUN84155.1 hypothetical protein AQJ64_15385 [Streptomyces griseoruber]